MNRRHKSNWRKERKERFAFSALEPRLLLAGDVTTISIYTPEFVGPVPAETSEISCAIEHTESDAGEKNGDDAVEYETADCSPTVMELYSALTGSNGSAVGDYDGRYRYTFSGSEAGTTFYYDSNFAAREANYSRIAFESFTSDAAVRVLEVVGTSAVNVEADQPISITSEVRSFKGPSDLDISTDAVEGKYFQIESSSSLASSSFVVEAQSLEQFSESSASNVGVISQRQMFALVSPDSFGDAQQTQGFTAKSQLSTREVNSGGLVATRIQTTNAFAPVEARDAYMAQRGSSGNRTLGNSVGVDFRAQLEPRMVSVREMIASENAQRAESNQQRFATSAGMRRSFTTMLYERIFEPFSSAEPTATTAVALASDRVNDTAQDDVRLARSIQILESAIILIGLPSSQLCREEDSSPRKKSM